jgi:hypothetical protein
LQTSNLILDFEFDQHLESHKHVINIIMRFRDMGCYSSPEAGQRLRVGGGGVPSAEHRRWRGVGAATLRGNDLGVTSGGRSIEGWRPWGGGDIKGRQPWDSGRQH